MVVTTLALYPGNTGDICTVCESCLLFYCYVKLGGQLTLQFEYYGGYKTVESQFKMSIKLGESILALS